MQIKKVKNKMEPIIQNQSKNMFQWVSSITIIAKISEQMKL